MNNLHVNFHAPFYSDDTIPWIPVWMAEDNSQYEWERDTTQSGDPEDTSGLRWETWQDYSNGDGDGGGSGGGGGGNFWVFIFILFLIAFFVFLILIANTGPH